MMKTNNDFETTQLVLDRPSRRPRDRNSTEQDDRPRCGDWRRGPDRRDPARRDPARDPARRNAPPRTTFEPLPLLRPAAWHATDYLTLGIGAVLIVGMFVAVAMGITWVILPGAAALLFAMISTQLRWGRMSRGGRLQWHRSRRGRERRQDRWRGTNPGEANSEDANEDANEKANPGGIVQLPGRKDRPRRAG